MPFDLASLGWDNTFAAAYQRYDRPDCEPVRVARVDRGACTVLTACGQAGGTARASLGGGLLAQVARDPVALPCAGDWAVLRHWPDDRATLEVVLPRRTHVVRGVAGGQAVGQILAANLDSVAVVVSIDPAPDLGRMERLLAIAWESGARPVVLLTKADLAPDPASVAAQVADAAPGVEVVAVSATRGDGIDRVRSLVPPGRTLGLLGVSGAGKSTLVNTLAGATVMSTQQIRRVDGRGRHTTTCRALIPLPGGGVVLDTPGVRGVGLFDAVDGLEMTFADLEELAARCRFAGCRHGDEPGCALRAALECGELSPRRFASWRKLRQEQAWQLDRRGARLAAEARSHRARARAR